MTPAERGAFLERPPSDAPSLDDAHEVRFSHQSVRIQQTTQETSRSGRYRMRHKFRLGICSQQKPIKAATAAPGLPFVGQPIAPG